MKAGQFIHRMLPSRFIPEEGCRVGGRLVDREESAVVREWELVKGN